MINLDNTTFIEVCPKCYGTRSVTYDAGGWPVRRVKCRCETRRDTIQSALGLAALIFIMIFWGR